MVALDVVLNAASAALGAGALWSLRSGTELIRSRVPASRLFRPAFRKGRRIAIIVPGFAKVGDERRVMEQTRALPVHHPAALPLMDYLDLSAALDCQAVLCGAGKADREVNIVTTFQLRGERVANLERPAGRVLIGAGSNPETIAELASCDLPYEFAHPPGFWDTDQAALVARPEAGAPPIQWRRTKTHDYAMIQRHSTSSEMRMVVAGLGAEGTRGAGVFLRRNWQWLARLGRGRDFGVVLRVERDGAPEAVERVELVQHSVRRRGGWEHVAARGSSA